MTLSVLLCQFYGGVHCIEDSPRRPKHLLNDHSMIYLVMMWCMCHSMITLMMVACVTLQSSDMLWCCVEWPLPCGQGTTSVLRECGHCLSMRTHTHTRTCCNLVELVDVLVYYLMCVLYLFDTDVNVPVLHCWSITGGLSAFTVLLWPHP